MNKIGIFMNFWVKNWDADHVKYIKRCPVLDLIFWNSRHRRFWIWIRVGWTRSGRRQRTMESS